MNKSWHRSKKFVRPIFSAALTLTIAGPAMSADGLVWLRADQITPLLSGATIELRTKKGFPMQWVFGSNGAVNAEIETPFGRKVDRGTWWVAASGVVCFRWTRIGNGRKQCRLLALNGKQIQPARPLNGEPIANLWNFKENGNQTERMIAALNSVAVKGQPRPRPSLTYDSFADIDFGNYHALVIGNNQYTHLPKLETAEGDAQAVADVLKFSYGFQVTLLKNGNRSDVIDALADMRAKLQASDNLLIYYAGHGIIDEQVNQGYWLPVNAKDNSPSNWISNADISTLLRGIRAKHVMVVSDSCYSGTLVRAVTSKIKTANSRKQWVKRMVNKRSRTALVSGGLEPVIDGGGDGHSVFAKAFLDALKGNRSVMDGGQLFDAIKRPVVLNADQTPEYSDIRKAGHDGGEFLFVRRGLN
jgi:hypothetical protein